MREPLTVAFEPIVIEILPHVMYPRELHSKLGGGMTGMMAAAAVSFRTGE